jgi:hypothetical protein
VVDGGAVFSDVEKLLKRGVPWLMILSWTGPPGLLDQLQAPRLREPAL